MALYGRYVGALRGDGRVLAVAGVDNRVARQGEEAGCGWTP